MLLLNLLGWEAAVVFPLLLLAMGNCQVRLCWAVVCCEVALPGGHCAIATLSLRL